MGDQPTEVRAGDLTANHLTCYITYATKPGEISGRLGFVTHDGNGVRIGVELDDKNDVQVLMPRDARIALR